MESNPSFNCFKRSCHSYTEKVITVNVPMKTVWNYMFLLHVTVGIVQIHNFKLKNSEVKKYVKSNCVLQFTKYIIKKTTTKE